MIERTVPGKVALSLIAPPWVRKALGGPCGSRASTVKGTVPKESKLSTFLAIYGGLGPLFYTLLCWSR